VEGETGLKSIAELIPVILGTAFVVGFMLLAFPSGPDARMLFVRTSPGLCQLTATAPVLELPAEGGYRLNGKPRKREEIESWFAESFSGRSKLVTWLREKFTPNPPAQRPLVIFRPDSSRREEKYWIVRMVNKVGGEVVSPSVRCPIELQVPTA
jgi:hypothetical protein